MNKFTLYFVDKEIEKQYTKENMQYIRKILLYLFQSFLLFMGIMTLGFNPPILTDSYIFGMAMASYGILSLITTYLNVISYQTLIIICNFVIMLIQTSLNHKLSTQQAFLRGSNTMMIHCSLIFVCDFPQAMLQIIILYFFRIIYTSFQENLVFDVIIAITLTSIVFSANCYRLSKINRRQYILRLSSIKWHNILQHVIEKKFIFFKYVQSNKSYQLIDSNVLNDQTEFINYIRQYRIGTQTIEQHLYNNYEFSLDITEICHIARAKSQEEQKFLLISFFVEFPNYLIILDDKKTINQLLVKQGQLMTIQYQEKLKRFVKMTLKSIHQSIEQRNSCILTKLRYVQFKYVIKQSPLIIKYVNLHSQISLIVKMLYNKSKRVNIKAINPNIFITTIQSIFLLFIIEVLNKFTSRDIQIEIEQEYSPRYSFQYGQNTKLIVQLVFSGKIKADKIQFEKFSQIISHYSLIRDKRKDQLIVLLNQDISFLTLINSGQ